MIPLKAHFSLLAMLATAACSSSSTGVDTSGSTANFAATIDGTAWRGLTLTTAASGSTAGNFTISGSNSLTASPTSMSLILYNISAPGTFPMGVGGSVTGGAAVVSFGGASWGTPLSGAAGSVTVSTVTSARIAGTFNFVATPTSGSAANKTVTSGTFDMALVTPVTLAVPDKAGGSFTGTLAGNPFTAATLLMVTSPSSGTLTFAGANSVNSFNVIISGYTGVGTYTLNTGVSRNVTLTQLSPATKTWGGSGGLSTGTVVVTSSTATRVKGTMNVTLQPGIASPGTGTLVYIGAFDVGVP